MASPLTFLRTLAFVENSTSGSDGSSLSCQKWELRICTVTEIVNDTSYCAQGGGPSKDVCALLASRKAAKYGKPGIHDLTMTTFCAAFLFVWVTLISTRLTEENTRRAETSRALWGKKKR